MSAKVEPAEAEQFRATVERSIVIDAPPQAVFESILEDMRSIPDGQNKPLGLTLEAYPGGRWFRDLGDGVGHLWGHVQVIKPPTLIEVYGPLMISSACISHVRYRLMPENGAQRLTVTHKLFGDFDANIPSTVGGGWQMSLDRIKAAASKAR